MGDDANDVTAMGADAGIKNVQLMPSEGGLSQHKFRSNPDKTFDTFGIIVLLRPTACQSIIMYHQLHKRPRELATQLNKTLHLLLV